MGRTVARLGLMVMTIAAMSACTPGDLLLRQDHLVELESPRPYALVHLPVVVSWQVRAEVDPSVARRVDHFLVFLDRAPQPPRESRTYFAAGNLQNIYEVNRHSLRVDSLPAVAGPASPARATPDATLI